MPNLHLEDISKTFGVTRAVDRLSVEVQEGESVVLLGPSGCGKTTLLKLLAGFLRPDTGRILVGDQVLSTQFEIVPPDKRKMSMVFQTYAIWPHKTVFQNVAYGLQVRKMKKTVIAKKVEDALSLVQLDGLAKRYSTELSGGQQQRVALARAMVVEPSILLLDEPLSNLDANLREEMREELSELHQRVGITFVYVTHDQAEAMVLGDRILLMNSGRLVQEGPPEQLYHTPKNRFAAGFIGTANIFSGRMDGRTSGPKEAIRVDTSFGPVTVGRETERAASQREDIFFCIRPEWITFHSGKPDSGMNRYGANILQRQYYGKYIRYVADLGGQHVIVEAPPEWDFQVGADVTVEFPSTQCVCLEND